VGFNFAVGDFPAGDKPDDAAKIESLLPSLAEVDAYGFHAYWLPQHWTPKHAWARKMLIWRYKEFLNLLPEQLQNKKVFITECGCDGLTGQTLGLENVRAGWTKYYATEGEYLKHLWEFQAGLDDPVTAAFVYECGAWRQWKSYELTPSLLEWALKHNVKGGVEMTEPTIRMKTKLGNILTLELEEYVKGVVPSEVYPNWPMQVLQAQAICARSYALWMKGENGKHKSEGFDVCSTQCCQVYSNVKKQDRTDQATESTRGIVGVLPISNLVAKMFYSASCGGHTDNDWAPGYLKSVTCPCLNHNEQRKNGHGRGMCQWGAYYGVNDLGWKTWKDILRHYFNLRYREDYGTGTIIVVDGVDEPEPDLQSPFYKMIIENKNHIKSLEEELNVVGQIALALMDWASKLNFREGV